LQTLIAATRLQLEPAAIEALDRASRQAAGD
jgi:hypothetical protein